MCGVRFGGDDAAGAGCGRVWPAVHVDRTHTRTAATGPRAMAGAR